MDEGEASGKMLHYACVCSVEFKQILADYNLGTANSRAIARGVLRRLDDAPKQKVFAFQQFKVYATVTGDGLAFIAVTDDGFSTRHTLQCIKDIESAFLGTVGEDWINKANEELSQNDIFSRAIRERLEHWNNPTSDKIYVAQEKMKKTREDMLEAMDLVITRGEKVEGMVERTNLLDTEAKTFRKEAKKVKHKMWCKQRKMCLCGTFVGLIVVAIIVIIIVAIVTNA